jgi:hypothetical protein
VLRLDAGTGLSVWWRDHADHHLTILLDADGPFKGCEDGHCDRPLEPLPYQQPQPGTLQRDNTGLPAEPLATSRDTSRGAPRPRASSQTTTDQEDRRVSVHESDGIAETLEDLVRVSVLLATHLAEHRAREREAQLRDAARDSLEQAQRERQRQLQQRSRALASIQSATKPDQDARRRDARELQDALLTAARGSEPAVGSYDSAERRQQLAERLQALGATASTVEAVVLADIGQAQPPDIATAQAGTPPSQAATPRPWRTLQQQRRRNRG